VLVTALVPETYLEREQRQVVGLPLRCARFLQIALAMGLLVGPTAASSRGHGGGGHGGHAGGGHGFHGFHGLHGFHGFHGRGRGFGFRGFANHGVLFLTPFEPFDFAPEPFSPGIPVGPFGCEDEFGGLSACPPPEGGLLQTGPALPERPLAARGEIDPTRAHWSEPDPGECPPDQKLLRLPGQRAWRCADPRLVRLDSSGMLP